MHTPPSVRSRAAVRWAGLVLAGTLGTVLTVGCSSSKSSAAEPAIGALPTFTSDSQVTMPLDAYLETTDQIVTSLKANEILVDRCMARYGFTFRLGVPSQPSLILVSHIGKFFVDNLETAKTSGYGGNAALLDRAKTPASPGDKPTDAERVVLLGAGNTTQVAGKPAPAGGCQGEANTILDKNAPPSTITPVDVLNNMVNSTYAKMLADSRVTKLVSAWSACMAKSGYSFTTPEQADDSPTAQAQASGAPTAAQINQAVADVTCKQSVNLVPTEIAVWTAYQNKIIEDNAQQLSLEQQQLKVETKNATDVVAQEGAQ